MKESHASLFHINTVQDMHCTSFYRVTLADGVVPEIEMLGTPMLGMRSLGNSSLGWVGRLRSYALVNTTAFHDSRWNFHRRPLFHHTARSPNPSRPPGRPEVLAPDRLSHHWWEAVHATLTREVLRLFPADAPMLADKRVACFAGVGC